MRINFPDATVEARVRKGIGVRLYTVWEAHHHWILCCKSRAIADIEQRDVLIGDVPSDD